MKALTKLSAAVVASTLLVACGSDSDSNSDDNSNNQGQVKNLILMIGDGMGAQQVGLLEEYARRSPANAARINKTTGLQNLAENGSLGLSMTAPMGANAGLIVDSACSATQLATGKGSISEAVGLDDKGNKVETILEKAQKMGKATGLITDTRLTHATPAGFASHRPHRSMENEIAEDLLAAGVDVLLGGGSRHWAPKVDDFAVLAEELNAPSHVIKKSKRSADDARNLFAEAKTAGYQLAFDKAQMAAVNDGKLLGLFDDSAMNDGIEYTACKNNASPESGSKCADEPSLVDMTKKALDILSKDPDGFFLMIEGGQIDWAGHVNDTGWLLHEMLKFDEAVQAVYEWAAERDDTLVVVTADHETGGFGFAYHKHDIPQAKTLQGDGMVEADGSPRDYQPQYNFGALATLDKIYAQERSFYDILSAVDGDWDFSNSSAAAWVEEVNKSLHADFHIDDASGEKIAARYDVPAEDVHPDHKYLSATNIPKFNDFSDFYVYADEDTGALIAREVAEKQSVTWGNGTHTAAPVPVYAFGPEAITKQFSTMQHHTDLGQKMMSALIVE
ncbi:alkaline phosphatase [Bacterioplanoides sp. SCSIO 12839]|uniref:alkaline phosphatase n=1 Tax=Bacterioplanoides sp. SCSIO 12839 TaxID=2829569 RepID=UPI002106D8E4|nr:alkaline phosphatase [Bacterioplanoides sp. SCSIO 12839]UTW48839.1 alkaline phosphatase [Bacterioplanoides sp. SCSIO 12839]